MPLVDRRGKEVTEGALVIDNRGKAFRVLPFNPSFVRSNIASVYEVKWGRAGERRVPMRTGDHLYLEASQLFVVPKLLPQDALRSEYRHLFDRYCRDQLREDLRARKNRVHRMLYDQGVRQYDVKDDA